jgi:drug/metabolite transporter (DMT)-like permease
VAVLPGVALLAGGVPREMWPGIAMGALSALFVAGFGALNKRFVHHGEPLTVTAIELGAGTLALTALAPLMPLVFAPFAGTLFDLPTPRDTALLLLLAFACTLLPFALSLVALRHMSAFAAQLAVNLEPLYAIALAAVLLGEQRELTALFYVAVAIILGSVFVHPFLSRRRRIEHPELLATAEAKQSVD